MLVSSTNVDDHTATTFSQGSSVFGETTNAGDVGWTWMMEENTTTDLDRTSTDASSRSPLMPVPDLH